MKIFNIEILSKLINESKNLEESFEVLEELLIDESLKVIDWDSIYITKWLVDRINSIKITTNYEDNHMTPHFHTKKAEFNASYRIKDCSKLAWKLKNEDEKKILIWYRNWWKEKLIEEYNKICMKLWKETKI